MKHLASSCSWLGTSLVVLLLMAIGLPARAQTEAARLAAELALQTRSQWAGGDIPATAFRISSAYAEPSGLLYAYPQQLQGGIPVYNQLATLVFKDGKLRHHAGAFLSTKAFAGQPATPRVAAASAVATALGSTNARAAGQPTALSAAGSGPEQQQTFAAAGVARRPIEVRLVWATDKGTPRLAWNVNVDLLATPDWLNIRVDAATGQVLGQDNWTVKEAARHPAASAPGRAVARPARHPLAPPSSILAAPKSTLAVTPASYLVVPYPGDRPDVAAPTTVTNPWLRAGTGNAAATYGWHFDGTTDYTYTRGNNVWAYKDSLNKDTPTLAYSTFSTGTSSSLVFNNIPDFTLTPTTGKNRRAAVTNLFYWNNLMHDVMYQYGFTEATGNFQASNLSRGGAEGDYVQAEAQDGGGTNNANFSTPPDGASGRMQMYLFTGITPTYTITVTAPATVAGNYVALESAFSTSNKLASLGPISGQLALYADAGSSPTTYLACGAYGGSAPLTGKIALLYRGSCDFVTKVKNAQLAGASAAIVINNVAGAPIAMGGSDNTVTIPAVMLSQADGATLVAQLANGVRVTLPKPAAAGPQLDGDYDSGVMTHEYGHGISNRLTGGGTNTSCLYNEEQAGEGWSDFFGLMMTTDWSKAQTTDGSKARPIGTYVLGQAPTAGGIRRYPYSTNMSVNPLTYADMAASPEAHDIGEIWCATLWDMAWNVIQMQGSIEPNLYNSASTGGNAVALQLVMQGLKLQPCQPGFLDSRDAILAADSLLYNGRYHCAIWGAFARRGMGYSAREGSSNSAIDQTAAYDVPSVTLSKNTTPLVGNRFNIAIKANCECPSQPNTYTITDQLPTDLQYLSSSPGGTLSGRTVTFAGQTFAAGQTRTYQIQAQTAAGKGCAVTLPINDNREANTTGGLTPAIVTGTTTWAATTTAAHSGTASWLAPSSSLSTNTTLTSAAFTPGSLAVLSFYQYANLLFDSGAAYDGGLVAISTDNGTTWTDAAPYFLKNGYDATFLNNTIIPAAARGKACFSGRFYAPPTPNLFTQSQLDLSSFSGQSIRIRFQLFTNTTYRGTDYGFAGWYLDDIQVLNGCGGNQQVQLLASGSTSPITSYFTPTFLTPIPAPGIISFTPTSGPVGTGVTITGTNLSGTTSVTFNGVAATTFATTSATEVTATVPTGATTGPIAVTTPSGTATSTTSFTVTAAPTAPTVTTATPSTVGSSSAVLGGTVTSEGGASVSERGVVYSSSTTTPTTTTGIRVAIGAGAGAYSQAVTGLAPATAYTVRAYAINNVNTSYGAAQAFTTTATLALGISTQTNVSCNGGTTGAATVAASGGTAPYRYTWSPNVSTTASATGLAAGSYLVTVTDNLNATAQVTVNITEPAALAATQMQTNVSSHGGSDGAASLSVSGGTAPYRYTWSPNVSTTASATGLAAGMYAVTVTDANNCGLQRSFTITEPATPTTTATPVVTAPATNSALSTTTPTYAGTAVAGSTVTVFVDGVALPGTILANSTTGAWAKPQPTALAQGLHNVYAQAQASGQTVSASSNTNNFTVDTVAPTVTALSSAAGASGSSTSTTPFAFSVTFSESVTGFSASGITATNGSVSSAPSGSGSGPYTFAVTPTTAGTATTVTIAANAAQDAAGNGSVASSAYSLTYTAPVATATTWTGTVSTDWFNSGNWTAGVPTSTLDAIIAAGAPRYPLLSAGTATTRALTLTGGSLSQAGGTLDVRGSWSNSGQFMATGGTVSLGQTAPASIVGSSSSRFWNLSVQASGAQLSTSAATSVRQVLTLTGNLATNGNPFTLLSSVSAGVVSDALVVNSGGVVVGTATAQRAIDPSLNAGLGYRHYSAPVSNTTVADLATSTFTPVVNPAYNSAAVVTTVTPFPTVYGYDDSRLSMANSLSLFDKGYISPLTLADALAVGKGYTVNIAGTELVDFQGTLNNGDRTLALTSTRPTYPDDGGWQLLGNPYPAPLDYSLVLPGDRVGLEAAMYVFSSTSQYGGRYRAYINNIGNPVIPMGQGFFTRVAAGQSSATLMFHNSQRLTAPNSTAFQRTAETRPLVQLTLQAPGGPLLDEATVYFEAGATLDFDLAYDAQKLPNPSGLNLSTILASGRQLSIDGQAALGAAQRVVPLAVGVPAAGTYTFTASQVLNLSAVPVYLRDLQLGTLIDLRQQPSYQFTVSTAAALNTSRFELVFSPQQPLATVPATLAQQVAVYPNPARTQVAIELPAALGRQPVTAALLDALGRTVRQQVLPANLASHTLLLTGVSNGVYSLRLTTELGTVVKKLVVD